MSAAALLSAPSPGRTLAGKMHFLTRDPKYDTEKPYTLRYAPDADSGILQTNIERVEHPTDFHDMRGREISDDLDYNKCGFAVAKLVQPGIKYEEFEDREKVEGRHAEAIVETVRKALGAGSAEMIDYVIRRRHPTWPVSTGTTYDFQQPASRAHIDHTYDGAVAVIREAHSEKADLVLERKWQLVNAWHPLQGPLIDWPLAVCDARTVDFAADTMAGDVVDRHQVFENTQVHHSPRQRWYYLSGQTPDEIIMFKNADSEEHAGAFPGCPHASFDNPERKDTDFRRESIEMRILVVW